MSIDPRDLFVSLNPLGLDDRYLVKGSTGFADYRTQNDYLVFLAGYKAGAADGEKREFQRHRPINAEGCKPDSNILPAGLPCADVAPCRSLDKAEGGTPDLIILSCPFCGGTADSRCSAGPNPDWWVECTECKASAPILSEEKLSGWNNRTQPATTLDLSVIAQAMGFEPEERPDGEGIAIAIRVLRTQLAYLGKHLWDLQESYELPPSARYKVEAALSGAADPRKLSTAACDVLSERLRQEEVEGYTSERDNQYTLGQLADAASTYAFWARTWSLPHAECTHAPTMWPWAPETWKPQSQRQMLIKAGALILAEIERLDRQQAGEVRHD